MPGGGLGRVVLPLPRHAHRPALAALGPPGRRGQGSGSVLTIRLSTDTESLGALNLYAGAGAFSQDDVDLALIYAAHATNAMSAPGW